MSKFDDLIERLAFGTDPGKGGPCLGLSLAPDVVYVAESRAVAGKLVADHLVRIPIPSDGKGPSATATMNMDFLEDPAKIGGLIRQSMSQLRWRSKDVRVTLSHHLGLLRYFALPAMDRKFLRSAVRLEAKKYIPIPFDILAHDYSTSPLPPDAGGRQRLGVLIAATQAKSVATVSGLLASLGLNLVGLEVAPCSVLRLWQAVDPQQDASSYAHVHIEGGNVRVMVLERGVPVFFREVFLGQDTGLSDMRKIDLPGSLSFVQKQLGLPAVTRLRVSGNRPDLPGLAGAFAQETGLSVSTRSMSQLLSVKSDDWGAYAALGASAPSPASASPPLNLAASGRVTDEERQSARDILLAGVVAALFFAGAGLWKSATYTYKAQELHRYQKKLDPVIALSLAGLTPPAIDALINDMQRQLGQLQAVGASGRNRQISSVLKEVIAAMPEKLWIEHLSIMADLMATDRPFEVVLRGHAQGQSVAEEQALAFSFKESLVKNPLLEKSFEVSMSVQKTKNADSDPGAPPKAAPDTKALAEMLERRTQFELELKAKK